MKYFYFWWNSGQVGRPRDKAMGKIGVIRAADRDLDTGRSYLSKTRWVIGYSDDCHFNSHREAMAFLYKAEGERVDCLNWDTKKKSPRQCNQ